MQARSSEAKVVNDNVLNVFIRFSVGVFQFCVVRGVGSYLSNFQHTVHRAERIHAAVGVVSEFVLRARLTAPLPIHYELIFVVTRCERQSRGPFAMGQVVVQWRGVRLPIVKSARDEYRLGFRRVAGQGNFVNVTVRL